MHRRQALQILLASSGLAMAGCAPTPGAQRDAALRVMTVNGWIPAADLGVTLSHEHLFADLRPYVEQAAKPLTVDFDEAAQVLLPHLQRIASRGCRSLVECTATNLGRHPRLIQRLSQRSGLHMLTVTGGYAAADRRFVPPYLAEQSAGQLAARWTREWTVGIDGTKIRPGLIKIGVDEGPLEGLELKLLQAALQTHLDTGLTIACHIGSWTEQHREAGRSAMQQLGALRQAGVHPSAWIWVHSQHERDLQHHVAVARQGGWISFDDFRVEKLASYVEMLETMRQQGLLHRVLVSQDAGWYTAGQPRGGTITPYDPLFTSLLPALRAAGFGEADVQTLMVTNPAQAFAVRVRQG
ncbi:MAG: phosphotriesterase [Rubrivivax sp.]|nr:MAG: phosphotriesterase [Rubrivivax sp.]